MGAYNYEWYGDDDNELSGAAGKAKRLLDQAALLEARNRLAAAQGATPASGPPVITPMPVTPAPAPAPGDAASPGLLDSITGAFSGLPSWVLPVALIGGAFLILKRR